MTDNPLKSLGNYSRFIAELYKRPSVERSTVTAWPISKYTGIAEGEVFFVPPNIKRNRIPAPEMSFTRPNLPALIQEIEGLVGDLPDTAENG